MLEIGSNDVSKEFRGFSEFRNIEIDYVSKKESLVGCRQFHDWLRKKKCLYRNNNRKTNLLTEIVIGRKSGRT